MQDIGLVCLSPLIHKSLTPRMQEALRSANTIAAEQRVLIARNGLASSPVEDDESESDYYDSYSTLPTPCTSSTTVAGISDVFEDGSVKPTLVPERPSFSPLTPTFRY
ncbi:hypothetical protein CANCADRAFT_4247 [Tortispora caseinolytica NRRL Y-17796]|uniref:Uncharacterized protein n=1 Tax=Tortispora caseinolytica NRRL Y-17796 TaxID=767744 RepID=A0A1E4TD38_9ASCO|nr:hypothetical protein CANCADRAFT_4247 [Tortispora caseinolytica NRRL Y-17796]